MSNKKINYHLNFLKGIACFGVVFCHVRLPIYYVDGLIQSMFRFLIPMFFMISGYFTFSEDNEVVARKLPNKIKHIGLICLGGYLYNALIQFAVGLLGRSHGGLQTAIERSLDLLTWKHTKILLLYNQDPYVNILWFTFALLYCYLLFIIVNKWNLYKLAYKLIPVLLCIFFLMQTIIPMVWENDIELYYYRNYLFFGMPFFLLGNYIHRHQNKINELFSDKLWTGLVALSCCTSMLEWYFIGRKELFLSSIVLVISLFVLALRKPSLHEKSWMTVIGDKYSLYIYIFHPSIMIVLERFTSKLPPHIFKIYEYIAVLVVFLLSALVAVLWVKGIGFCKAILKGNNR